MLPHFQNLPSQTIAEPPPDAPILYFGRLSAEKGLTDLLRAMQHFPHVSLQIAGEGPQRAELEELARDLESGQCGICRPSRGASTRPADFFLALHRVAFTAYETLGKTILESYAWGRAVVASDLGSRRELVREGKQASCTGRAMWRNWRGRFRFWSNGPIGGGDGRGGARAGGRAPLA